MVKNEQLHYRMLFFLTLAINEKRIENKKWVEKNDWIEFFVSSFIV